MANIRHFGSAAATLVVIACTGSVLATTATAAHWAAVTSTTEPLKVALVTRERSAYEAWKFKDVKFWHIFLSDKFVGWGSLGRLDKASAAKEYNGADCEIKSYALSAEQMSTLGKNAALLTYRATVDGTCGDKIPVNSWAASVYVHDGSNWQAVFHAAAPVVDPKLAPMKPVDKKARKSEWANSISRDARTDSMLAVERAIWAAWRANDAKRLEALTAEDISFINIFGTHLATKADALENWSGTGCDVKSVAVNDAVGTMLSPTVGILAFRATADGTCYGQKVSPILGTTVYVKDGDAWKWTFGINLPARGPGP